MAGAGEILISEISPERRALCSELGARPIDPTAGPLIDRVQSIFGSKADVTLDAVGISPTMNDALSVTVLGGTVALVGMGSAQVDLRAFAVSTEERAVVGSFTYTAQDFADAAAWAGSHGRLLSRLLSHIVGPEQAGAAFNVLASGDETPGKILVGFAEIPGADGD